jgi:hypothetical protein
LFFLWWGKQVVYISLLSVFVNTFYFFPLFLYFSTQWNADILAQHIPHCCRFHKLLHQSETFWVPLNLQHNQYGEFLLHGHTLMGLFSMLHNLSFSVSCIKNVSCLAYLSLVMVKRMNSKCWWNVTDSSKPKY